MEIGDHVTILQDGKYVADADVKDIDVPWIVHQMTGGAKSPSEAGSGVDWSKVENVLEVKDLCLPKAGGGYLVDHLNFRIKEGRSALESTDLWGRAKRSVRMPDGPAPGAYRTDPHGREGTSYQVHLQQIDSGFALIPEDRQMQGTGTDSGY